MARVYDDEKTGNENQLTGNDFTNMYSGAGELRDAEARAVAGADQDRAKKADKNQLNSAESPSKKPGDKKHPKTSVEDTLGKGWTGGNKKKRFKLTRKKAAGGIAAIMLGGGGLGLMGVAVPSLQLMAFSDFLQKTHLTRTESFMSARNARNIMYALAGMSERGRLGVVMNRVADAVEARVLERTGLSPGYDKNTGRMRAYVVEGPSLSAKHERELRRQGAVKQTAPDWMAGSKGKSVAGKTVFVFPREYKASRSLTTYTMRETFGNKITAAVAGRQMKKRGGITFNPLGAKRAVIDRLGSAESREKRAERRAEEIKKGAKAPTTGNIPPEAQRAIDKVKSAATEDSGNFFKTTKMAIARSSGPAIFFGAVCVTKAYGDQIENYKYVNNYLPLMRLGALYISAGDQAKSGVLNTAAMNDLSEALYDQQSKTSWMGARSVQAERGVDQTGPDVPEEAKLGSLTDKPRVFNWIDAVPGLGPACGIFDLADKVPGFSTLSDIVGSGTMLAVNTALKPFGTSSQELLEASLSIAAGEAVNVSAKGAILGNLANVGAFIFANDLAISGGGAAMSATETSQLKTENETLINQDQSFFARYLDPSSHTSLLSNLAIHTPGSFGQLRLTFNPSSILSSIPKGLFSFGSVHAQSSYNQNTYDYGIPTYGFTLSEQSDPRFENPFENAAIVEPKLDELNDKYGKCFSMKITETNDGGVGVESSEAVNVFDIAKDSDCSDGSEDLLRYRFYIADTLSAVSMACYEGDPLSCSQIYGEEIPTENTETTENTGYGTLKSVNGYDLSDNESKHIKYIAESVMPHLAGSDNEKIKIASLVTWWSLKEGILRLDNPFGYSNCSFGVNDDRHIDVVENCETRRAWQVGISGVQVLNFSQREVERVARERNPGKSLNDILSDVAKLAGLEEGSVKYNQVVNSTGDLRKSLLLRDPATGFSLVYRDITSECIQGWESWCGDYGDPKVTPLAKDQATAKKAISELETYFSNPGSSETNDLSGNKSKLTDILTLPTGAVGPSQVAYYNQCDSRWGQKPYPYTSGGSNTICASACGPVSLAMVISTIGNKFVTAEDIVEEAIPYHVSGGTNMSGAIKLVEKYGLSYRKISGTANELKEVLDRGGLVVYNVKSNSPFTNAGHFIVIRAISNDGSTFYVADPSGADRSKQGWPVSSISNWAGIEGLYAVTRGAR